MSILFPFFVGFSVCLATVMASSGYAPAPAYKAEVYPVEVLPYTYTYAVADDYSKASFSAEETSDGASNVQGSYSVALPDGRIQRVVYTSNGYDGYVADVTYEGTAQYPDASPDYKPAPVAHAIHPAPNPCQRNRIFRRGKCQSKYFGFG